MRRFRQLWPWIACVILWALALMAFVSCSSGKTVIVPEVRQTVVHQRDTVFRKDSIAVSSTTVVQRADSVMMAELGIRLDNMEQVWLVRQTISKDNASYAEFISHKDSVVHDSIPVPYPETVYKDKELSLWQGMEICLGQLAILVIVCAAIYAVRIIRKRRNQ